MQIKSTKGGAFMNMYAQVALYHTLNIARDWRNHKVAVTGNCFALPALHLYSFSQRRQSSYSFSDASGKGDIQ